MPTQRLAVMLACVTLCTACTARAEATDPPTQEATVRFETKDVAWERRLLLVFAPAEDHPEIVRQRTLLADQRGALLERHMVVVFVVGAHQGRVTGADPSSPMASAQWIDQQLDASSASALRAQYSIPLDDFAVRLVGKDTGTKIARSEVLEPRELYGTIDQMPMRRREAREAGGD